MKRITVDWNDPKGKHINFDIYTDSTLEFLQGSFFDWILKTKVYSAESFCRYARKKIRKIKILSQNQYLNFLTVKYVFKTGYKKYF